MDKVVDSGSTDAGSIPVRDAKVDMSSLSGFGIFLFLPTNSNTKTTTFLEF